LLLLRRMQVRIFSIFCAWFCFKKIVYSLFYLLLPAGKYV
jgi:hypothetical protein